MGKVLEMVTNRFSAGRAAGAGRGGDGRPTQSLDDESGDSPVPSRSGLDLQGGLSPQGGLSQSTVALGPLGALAASAAAQTDIPQLLQSAVQTVVETLSLGHVLIWTPEYPHTPIPNYAAAGWNAKQQRRLVRRLAKKFASASLAGRAVPASPDSHRAAGYSSCETRLLKKQGLDLCLLTIAGDDWSRVLILTDRREVPKQRKTQVSEFFGALAGVLGVAVSRARQQNEISQVDALVRRAKIQWEEAVDSLHQLVCVIDRSGHVIRANRTLEAWGLGSVKTAPGKTIHALLHPNCDDADCRLKAACGRARRAELDAAPIRFEIADPALARELQVCLVPNRNVRGEPEADSFGFAIIEDVTERNVAQQMLEHFNLELHRRVEDKTQQLNAVNQELRQIIEEHCRDRRALEQAQEKYTNFVENTLTGIYLLEHDRISFCNSRFAALLGYAREELTDRKITDILRPVEPGMRQELAGKGWGEANFDATGAEQLCRGRTSKGNCIWLKTSRAQILVGGELLIVGNAVDVTEQIEAETVLIRSERELRDLSAQLMTAQEEERQRIAGELHDGIGQQLSVIKFSIERVLEGVRGAIPSEQEEEVGAIVARVRQTIEEVRRVSMDLRPSILDDLGVVSTIDWFCREFQQMQPKLAIHKNVRVQEGEIPPALKVAIFRILQESFNNIAKYAKATLVSVKLVRQEGTIRFSVSDDGTGFDYQKLATRGKGFGLGSMKQRAKLSGGGFRMSSAPGLGTRIEVEWPLGRGRSAPD